MEFEKLLKCLDHTFLKSGATWEQVRAVIEEAVIYRTASACIPPCFIKDGYKNFGGKTKLCTVVGFPNGYNLSAVKLYEAEKALSNGADEIDAVINIGWVKEGNYAAVFKEISDIKRACGTKILKVIIETCLLTETEKIEMCRIINQSGADYIKTSTGFAKSGAELSDIALFRAYLNSGAKIKASGGIRTLAQAQSFVLAGCDRIGASSLIEQIKEKEILGRKI